MKVAKQSERSVAGEFTRAALAVATGLLVASCMSTTGGAAATDPTPGVPTASDFQESIDVSTSKSLPD